MTPSLFTECIQITDIITNEGHLRRGADILCQGGLVVFPTETVYGLGGNGLDGDAAKKI